jgi:hypothetical protein
MEPKVQFQNKNRRYVFSTSQICAADVRKFLNYYDPFRLTATRLRDCFANLTLGFERMGDDPTIPTNLAIRILFQRLHATWPWAGFFMKLDEPLGPTGPVNDFPLFALGLCVSDFTLGLWDSKNEAFLQVGPQLRAYRTTCHDVVDKLGKRAALPASVLDLRHAAIDQQFAHALK